MPSARPLMGRLRRIAPEAFAFGVIGAANSALYFAITYVALPIGAVKATVIATVVTTTLAYVANRYWTYRHHTRSALRREYTLFFGFNGVGMVIQSGAVAVAKYGFHLNESDHKMLIMGITLAAAVVATVFRFWAYRTFVFTEFIDPEGRDRAEDPQAEPLEPEVTDVAPPVPLGSRRPAPEREQRAAG
jgi:putative flippase GtrA